MRNNLGLSIFCFILSLLTISFQPALFAQDKARQVPAEVKAIAGTYTGSWTMYGVDEKGQTVKRVAWTDVIKAENPVATGDRAYVSITDEMTFEGGRIPPRKSQGTEGYMLNADGSLGDYFIEVSGQRYRMQKLGKDAWAYAAPADPREVASLGFSNVLSAQHALVKVVTQEEGIETHRISRLTTVNWKDAEGKQRWTQFISLQGFHKRQTP
ncbi:MAG: hypothetical protein WCF57_00720 [Pyrinomonadaceae bacterium]